jgi:putative molybdopterin biosynthesis protein
MLTVEQVASRLSVAERTVLRLIKKGELVAFRVGNEYRIEETELQAYLERVKVAKR